MTEQTAIGTVPKIQAIHSSSFEKIASAAAGAVITMSFSTIYSS